MMRVPAAVILLLSLTTPVDAQGPPVVPTTNPPALVQQRIGLTDVEVRYNRPAVRGRRIFGALVPFDQVWRTGSDSATKITFSTAATVGGSPVAAGTYELFTIPGRHEWSVILQPNRTQWGSYSYDPANDVARVRVAAVESAEVLETFSIDFSNLTRNSAAMTIAWDRTRVRVPITVDVVGQVVPRIHEAMKAPGRKPYFLAAMFYFEHDLDLDQAATWMAAAIAEQPGHVGMLYRQALILEKKGDLKGALSAAQQSLTGAQVAARELREEYTRLNAPVIERLTIRLNRIKPPTAAGTTPSGR